MSLSCQRCKLTTNGPLAFLLTCRGCNKTWHHRCHMPPIEDDELIRRIRATNTGDTVSGNDLRSWMCRRCAKKGATAIQSASSHEPTAFESESRDDSRGRSWSSRSTSSDALTRTAASSSATTPDVDLTEVDVRKQDSVSQPAKTEVVPVKPPLIATKRPKAIAVSQCHAPSPPGPTHPEVQMTDVTHTRFALQGKTPPQEPTPVDVDTGSQGSNGNDASFVPTSEDEVEMSVDLPTPRPADEVVTQQQVDQDVYDDPEDLYGPPVERRVIRILPPVAFEMIEQHRRLAAEKEKGKRRENLGSDWMLTRHTHDPSWSENTTRTEGYKKRKSLARKSEVNELDPLGCFTLESWVRKHGA